MTTVSSNENKIRHDDNETNDKQKLTPILLSLNSNYSNIVDGIFLLLLAISGNFLAETMGCSIQKLLSTNQQQIQNLYEHLRLVHQLFHRKYPSLVNLKE